MKRSYIVFGGILTLTLFFGAVLSSFAVEATGDTSVIDNINITVPITCTLSGVGMDSHNASELANGTYEEDIGATTVKAFCNDNDGFAIYAAGYTGDKIGDTNSNKLIGTSASSNATIDTGTATSAGSSDVSNWAMKLSTVSSPTPTYPLTIDGTFGSYHEVPNVYTKVAHRDSATDIGASAEGATFYTTYAAYISKTQPADTYSGQVIYTLVHPSAESAPVVCNPDGTTISDVVCMQDISSTNKAAILTSMTEGTQYTLIDKRDKKNYTLAKLADGNIWMTQNLDLNLDASKTYTNEDTDLGWNGTGYSAASWTPERNTYATGINTWGLYNTTTGELDGTVHPESYDPGNVYWNGSTDLDSRWEDYYDSCVINDDTLLYENCDESLNPISTYVSSTGIPQYHLGNYYNWTAAVAMNNSSSYNSGSTDQSICPTGWTLPKGGEYEYDAPSGSFQYLVEQYGWTDDTYTLSNNRKIWESPIYFGMAGRWFGSLTSVGDVRFWSLMADGANSAYYLYASLDGEDVSPDSGGPRNYGFVVRCMAR